MMSSMETRPSVPPYSSITSARWVWVACILSSRSSARMDGGTNRMGRLMRGDARHSATGDRRRRRRGSSRRQHVLHMDQAGGIVERLAIDRQARMLRLAEQRDQFGQRRCFRPPPRSRRAAPSRRAPSVRRMRAGWPASPVPAPTGPGDWRSLSSITSSRLSRMAAAGRHPRRASFCSRRLTAADGRSMRRSSRRLVGIGDAQPRQDFHFQRLPSLWRRGRVRDHSRPDAARHAPPDGWHDRQGSCPPPWLPAASRHRPGDVAAIAVVIRRGGKGQHIGRLVLARESRD